MDSVLTWLSKYRDALIVGTIIAVVAGVLVAAILKALPPLRGWASGWAVKSWRWVNKWRKRLGVTGTPSRAQVISRWEGAPLRVLNSTLFRWFEADPQAWCGYVRWVYDSHNSEAVRERARGLLWVDKAASDLQVGDVYEWDDEQRGCHVLGLRHHGDWIEVVTDANYSPNPIGAMWGTGGKRPVRVYRGWCPLDDCSYCSMDVQKFGALAERVRAAGYS